MTLLMLLFMAPSQRVIKTNSFLVDLLDQSEIIVWVQPDYPKDRPAFVWTCESHQEYDVKVLEVLKGPNLEKMHIHGHIQDLRHENKAPILLFINRDENGNFYSDRAYRRLTDHFTSLRPFLYDYLELRKRPPSMDRKHAMVDVALDLFENEFFRYQGAKMLEKLLVTEDMIALMKRPVWERTGPDPNQMTLTQRARLMNSLDDLHPHEMFLLDLAWPFNQGVDSLLARFMDKNKNQFLEEGFFLAMRNRYKDFAFQLTLKDPQAILIEQISSSYKEMGPVYRFQQTHKFEVTEAYKGSTYQEFLAHFDCLLGESGPMPF